MNTFSWRHAVWFTVMAVFATAACESPTRPDPRIPPAVGTPTRLQVSPCEYLTRTARCPVDAIWGDLYRSTRTVTATATWSSDSPGVVSVINGFTLQAGAPGTAIVTIEYEGRRETIKFRVLAEGPPWRVLSGEYHIQVRDTAGQAIEGATVEIVAGANAGLAATSDQFGRAIFIGDTACGPITVRATKAGYREWTGSAIHCGRAGNGNWGSETIGPVVMAPS